MQTYASTKSNTGNNKLLFRDHLAILLCSSLSSLFLLKTQSFFFKIGQVVLSADAGIQQGLTDSVRHTFTFLSKLKFLNFFSDGFELEI